jgi:restriction system protein
MSLPSDRAVQALLALLIARLEAGGVPLADVAEIKKTCAIDDQEWVRLVQLFAPNLAFQMIGPERIQIRPEVLGYKARLPHCTLTDALQYLRGHQTRERLTRTFRLNVVAPSPVLLPGVAMSALLEFAGQVDDGRLVRAVALPWFEIIEMIQKDPNSIYSIDPFKWEEIIAGAYEREGFDEVILTPRSGDRGRDVIATKYGVGSVRFFDQVKRYKPGHLVTADEVRAMMGVISGAQNVSKGIITTTSEFAPHVREDPFIRNLVPFRIELKPRDELLAWLGELSANHGKPRI